MGKKDISTGNQDWSFI